MGRWIKRWMAVITLALFLTACADAAAPSQQLVKAAIELEFNQIQTELSQQLRLEAQPTQVTISHLRITDQTPLVIQDLPSYRIRGRYDYTMKVASRRITRQKNPFDIYLQRQSEGKTWRSARLIVGEEGQPIWVTQGLPL